MLNGWQIAAYLEKFKLRIYQGKLLRGIDNWADAAQSVVHVC